MKKNLHKAILFVSVTFSFVSCNINNSSNESPFPSSIHYIAGTLTPEESTRYSPFLIRFEDESVAHFINTTKSFPGKYTFQEDTLFFQTDDLEKVAVFAIENQKITDSHYEVRFYKEDGSYDPAPVKYDAAGELGETPENNQLEGKSFIGEQYRFGMEGVFQEGFIYSFAASGNTYGSGTDTENIDDQQFTYELFNNVAFRHEEGSTREFGILMDGQLIVFRESGLFYWGTFDPQ